MKFGKANGCYHATTKTITKKAVKEVLALLNNECNSSKKKSNAIYFLKDGIVVATIHSFVGCYCPINLYNK